MEVTGDYRCDCVPGYDGRNCEDGTPQTSLLHLFCLLDIFVFMPCNSDDVRENYCVVQRYSASMTRVVTAARVTKSGTSVGVVAITTDDTVVVRHLLIT